MAHGAAHDAAQHVAAPSLEGSTPSAIRKARGAEVVGDDAVVDLPGAVRGSLWVAWAEASIEGARIRGSVS
jgi:hypothetical protein